MPQHFVGGNDWLSADGVNLAPSSKQFVEALPANKTRCAGDEDALHATNSGGVWSLTEISAIGQPIANAGSFHLTPRARPGE